MTDTNHGVLRRQPSGRWAVCSTGKRPVELTVGDTFHIEVGGELKLTRIEFRHFGGPMKGRTLHGLPGEYYSVDGYCLRDGTRTSIP